MKAAFTHLFIWTILLNIPAFAQNYQTIQSNEIHYFSTQNYEYVLATKVSNVETSGSDSIFYTFNTIRENQDLAPSDYGHYYVGDAWMGPKIVIEGDGTNIFYNQDQEPIYIETQAAVNDTFLVYTYDTGEWIKGTVTNIFPISVFDVMDSVKVIELFSNTVLELTNPRIMLSKDHGFIEWFAPYTFPYPYEGGASLTGDNGFPVGYTESFELVGIDDTMGVHKPTVSEIYDYEIGDEYQLLYSVEDADGNTVETFEQLKVVNKFMYSEDDSVSYFIEKTMQTTRHPSSGQSETTVSDPVLEKVSAFNLAAWNTQFVPEEFDGTNGWSTLLINGCDDLEEVIYKQAFINYDTDSVLVVDPEGANLKFKAIKGVGWLEPQGQSVNSNISYHSELVFYDKMDGTSCGGSQTLSTDEWVEEETTLSLFPNPTNGPLTVQLDPESSESQLQLFDESGRMVRTWQLNATGTQQLDLSDLSAGMYTLLVNEDRQTRQEKIIKK